MTERDEKILKMVEFYRGLLMEDPTLPIFVKLAGALLDLNRVNEAKEVVKGGIEHNQKLPEGYILLSRIQRIQGELKNASESINRALQLDPFNVEALMEEALLMMDFGDAEKAIASLEKALDIEPEDMEIKRLRATIRAKTRFEEMKKYVGTRRGREIPEEELVETTEEAKTATPSLAELYLKQGYLKKARDICKTILAKEPENERVVRIMAQIEQIESARDKMHGEFEFEIAPVPTLTSGERGEYEFKLSDEIDKTFRDLELEDVVIEEPIPPDRFIGFDFDQFYIREGEEEGKPPPFEGRVELMGPGAVKPESHLGKKELAGAPELELPESIDISDLDEEVDDISKFQDWLDKLISE